MKFSVQFKSQNLKAFSILFGTLLIKCLLFYFDRCHFNWISIIQRVFTLKYIPGKTCINSKIFPSVISKRINMKNELWIIKAKTETWALYMSYCLVLSSFLHIEMNSDKCRWDSLKFLCCVQKKTLAIFVPEMATVQNFCAGKNNLHIDYILNLSNCHSKCRPSLHTVLSLLTNVYLLFLSARWSTSLLF